MLVLFLKVSHLLLGLVDELNRLVCFF